MQVDKTQGTWKLGTVYGKATRNSGEIDKIRKKIGDKKNGWKIKYGVSDMQAREKNKKQKGDVFEQYKYNLIWAYEQYCITWSMIWLRRGTSEPIFQNNKCLHSSQSKTTVKKVMTAF